MARIGGLSLFNIFEYKCLAIFYLVSYDETPLEGAFCEEFYEFFLVNWGLYDD